MVAGLSLVGRCRFMEPTKIKVHFEGQKLAEQHNRSSRHMHNFVPGDIAYTPISSSFSSSSFLSLLTLPLFNVGECELISCSFNFAMLFCTEKDEDYRSEVSHTFRSNFSGIENIKELYKIISIFIRFYSAN